MNLLYIFQYFYVLPLHSVIYRGYLLFEVNTKYISSSVLKKSEFFKSAHWMDGLSVAIDIYDKFALDQNIGRDEIY